MTSELALAGVVWLGGSFLAALTAISIVYPLRSAALPLPMLAAAVVGFLAAGLAWPWPAVAAVAAAFGVAAAQRPYLAGDDVPIT